MNTSRQLVDKVLQKLSQSIRCTLVEDTFPVKYDYNTSLHVEDDMGRRLRFKTVDELWTEILRCNYRCLRLTLHQVDGDPDAFYLYYTQA